MCEANDDLDSSSGTIRPVDASSSKSGHSPRASPSAASSLVNVVEEPKPVVTSVESKNQEPSDFRPGRLSAVDVLTRIFPNQKKNVIELVLQGCSGDILKAIEQFLSINDAFLMHSNRNRINHNHSNSNGNNSGSNPRLDPINHHTSTLFGSNKSAFTPLTPTESAITPPHNPFLASSIQPQVQPPLPPTPGTHFPFPYNFNRDFSMSSFTHHPAVQFLMNHHNHSHHQSHHNSFSSLLPHGCTPGCGQCPPPPSPTRVSPLSAFRDVRGQQSAVDLSTETTTSSWRGGGHHSSGGGTKCPD